MMVLLLLLLAASSHPHPDFNNKVHGCTNWCSGSLLMEVSHDRHMTAVVCHVTILKNFTSTTKQASHLIPILDKYSPVHFQQYYFPNQQTSLQGSSMHHWRGEASSKSMHTAVVSGSVETNTTETLDDKDGDSASRTQHAECRCNWESSDAVMWCSSSF